MRFEHQEYQEECIKNIISVLEDYNFESDDIDKLQENINNFYKNNNTIPDILKTTNNKFKKLDVLMETGTGKTFVYLKTIFELNKKFSLNKFIIFVPRKAIREGVIQNINLTKEFFYSDCDYKKYLSYYTYDGNVESVNNFIRDKEELSVLILTNSSIDKEKNNLRKKINDLYFNSSTLDEIVKTNPIIILDEPHLLKGDKFTEIFLETFKNNLYIRFGATFPNDEENKINNIIYSLDSITSFNRYLVKGIRVNNIMTQNDDFEICNIKNKEVEVCYSKNEMIYKNILKINEDIGQKTGLNQYNGIYIVKIKKDTIYLSNKTERKINNDYNLSDKEIELMIDESIKLHFEKEEELFERGIKELSLFFIPNIKDFRGDNPRVKNIFEKRYREIRKVFYNETTNEEYKKYLDKDFSDDGKLLVCQGYFSGDKGTNDDKEKEGIDKILKDKEKLLSFNEPLRFVFSVWALQEGWDNPNIFNICKLSNNSNDIKRRQQVGRGLRLCVNQDGQRITFNYLKEDEKEFYKINTLDVIVSNYEKNFIEEIQKEIINNSYYIGVKYFNEEQFNELGFNKKEINSIKNILEEKEIIKFVEEENEYIFNKDKSLNDFIKNNRDSFSFLDDDKYNLLLEKSNNNLNKIVKNGNNKNNKVEVKIKEEKLDEFKKLWENINRKTRIIYKDLDEDKLINDICIKFEEEKIDEIKIKREVKVYNAQKNEITTKKIEEIGSLTFFKNEEYQDFIQEFIKKYTYNFTMKLFNKIDLTKIKNNPKKAKQILDNIIEEEIHKNIINKIDYDISEVNVVNSLTDKNGEYRDKLIYTELGLNILDNKESKENYLFDKVVYDSDIEKDIILENYNVPNCNIVVFAKLPKIHIPTPYKTYNPDFGYLIKTDDKKCLFLIVESKGYDKKYDIPEKEKNKIKYAEKFFEKLQDLLPDDYIKYKTRINKEDFTNLLNDVLIKIKE